MAIINPNTGPAWKTVWKPSTTGRNTTTTLTDDPHLLFPMLASQTYFIEAWIAFFNNDATADFKYAVAVPAAGNSRDTLHQVGLSATMVTNIPLIGWPTSTTVNFASGDGNGFIHLRGLHSNGVNAGNWSFQWAQAVSTGNDGFVLAGSHIRYFQAT